MLAKSSVIIYFIPPIIITFFYLTLTYLLPTFIFNDFLSQLNWFTTALLKIGQIIDFILSQLYIFIILTFLSPFNTLLSKKVDTFLGHTLFSASLLETVKDIFRMIGLVCLILILQFFSISLWWIFAKIVGFHASWFYHAGSFLISAFFIGFSFYDYSLERYRVSIFKSFQFGFKNIALVTMTGIIFKMLYAFPYIWDISYLGILIAPIFTTILSTIIYKQHFRPTNKLHEFISGVK